VNKSLVYKDIYTITGILKQTKSLFVRFRAKLDNPINPFKTSIF